MFDTLYAFSISLFIGILIGVEREREIFLKKIKKAYGGISTSIFISLISATLAYIDYIDKNDNLWIWIIGLAIISLFTLIAYFVDAQSGHHLKISNKIEGITTYIFAGMPILGHAEIGIILTLIDVAVSHLRWDIHKITNNIRESEFIAFLKIFLIIFLILPIIPNENWDKYVDFIFIDSPNYNLIKDLIVFNPYKTMMILTVVSGISIIGYMLMKLYGDKGAEVSGLVGGMYSSTTTSLAIFSKSKEKTDVIMPFVIAILFSLIAMLIRSAVEINIFSNEISEKTIQQAIILSCIIAIVGIFYARNTQNHLTSIDFQHPFTVKNSFIMTLYVVVALFLSKITVAYLDSNLIYLIAIVLGSVKIDPTVIALSTLSNTKQISQEIIMNSIMIAWATNIVQKVFTGFFFGNKKMIPYLIIPCIIIIIYVIMFVFNNG